MDHGSDVSVRAHCYQMAIHANHMSGGSPALIMSTAIEIYKWVVATQPAPPSTLKAAA